MATDSRTEILFSHFERFLGAMSHRWIYKDDQRQEFDVFVYLEQPEADSQSLVTFGLSSHHFHFYDGGEAPGIELAVCANSSYDSKALGVFLLAVGRDAIKSHRAARLHSVIPGSGPVMISGNPVFEHLYLTNPGYFPRAFDVCEELMPPVEIVQLIPISSGERDMIAKKGWAAFEDAIVEQNVDLLEFDDRREVVFEDN